MHSELLFTTQSDGRKSSDAHMSPKQEQTKRKLSVSAGRGTWIETLDRFFMAPGDLRMMNVVRIACGCLILLRFLQMWPQRHAWFGPAGVISHELFEAILEKEYWTIFDFIPRTDTGVTVCFLIIICAAVSLALQILCRWSALLLLIMMTGLQASNSMLFAGSDTVMRMFTFFLFLLPAPDKIRHSTDASKNRFPVWPMRLFQLQVCLVLFSAGISKLETDSWLNGDALYYAFRLQQLTLVPLPGVITENITVLKLLTWSVLVVEIFTPIFIWFRKTRLIALVLVFALHFGCMYALNLVWFQSIMLVGWMSFLTFDDLTQMKNVFRKRSRSVTVVPSPSKS